MTAVKENLVDDWNILNKNNIELHTCTSRLNSIKNRYNDHFAPDHTLVKLSNGNYINANNVYVNDKKYIVTQAPILEYIDDFWDTIWEKNIDAIIMLTNYTEGGKIKADEYLPPLGKFIVSQKYIISCASKKNICTDRTIIITTLKIMSLSKNKIKILYHHFYKGWPDYGVPSLRPNVNKCKFNKFMQLINPTHNLLVHCSAGVGRSGCFCAIDSLFRLKNYSIREKLLETVFNLRNQRIGMVQTFDQYKFCFEFLEKSPGTSMSSSPKQ